MPEPSSQNDKDLRIALERTVAAEQFSAEGLRREMERTRQDDQSDATPQRFLARTRVDQTPTPTEDQTAGPERFGDTSSLPAPLIADEEPSGPRYRVIDEIGKGGTARVYAVQDRSLNRTVALKVLRGQSSGKHGREQRFIHEARVTAMLEHPNVMPVHDIGISDSGRVFFTMKNITGMSLGDAIRAARDGGSVPESFATLNGTIGAFLKVCEALSFAHDKGFVHQDVKPDNVMLGQYGEVLLLDWGCALSAGESVGATDRPMYGTPAYMSPEQARREPADGRSDVYCLGATLFHALALRHPVWDNDPEAFWEKKRAGTLDELTAEERRRVPKALRAMLAKALDPDPAGRYQTVAELHRDLERFQAGQAVLAYRESPFEAFSRWYRHNRRLFWGSTAATVLVLSVGGLLFREKMLEALTWQQVFAEGFDGTDMHEITQSWKAVSFPDWMTKADAFLNDSSSAWVVRDGALYGTGLGDGAYNIAYDREVRGDLRIEWDITPLGSACTDLNCFLAGSDRLAGYMFHVGGYGMPGHVTLTRKGTQMHLDRMALPEVPRPGVTYRFRMEREGYHVRFYMDGVKVIDYSDMDVLSGTGHRSFGFEVTRGKRQRIDNVRVLHHPLPRRVSPIATPREFEEDGQFDKALVRYRSLANAYPGTDIAAQATFRSARCLQRMDSAAAALEGYQAFEAGFPGHQLVPLSIFQRSEILRAYGRDVAADAAIASLAREHPNHSVGRTAVTVFTERAG
ncbi:MAG: protein kinase, partial [Chitinivibrionales bacterium]|nr:protein kinase [Chitinivibrionales bacterium]